MSLESQQHATLPVIAPHDPEFYRDPSSAFTWLHSVSPAHLWVSPRGRPMYLLSRWTDVRFVSSHPVLFSSAHGHTIDDHNPPGGRPSPEDPRFDTPLLHNIDPPEHSRHRKLVSRALTARRVALLEPAVQRVVREVLDRLPSDGEVDAVATFAAVVPLRVIAEMLGVPGEDLDRLGRWSDEIAVSADTTAGRTRQEVLSEFFDYLDILITERRREPRNDLITSLAFAQTDGNQLSHAELLMHIWTLLVAGNETTRNAIAGGVEAFVEHPEQYAQLVADPGLVANATEEILRWVTPARYGGRTVTQSLRLGEHDFLPGEYVLMLYSAANRDPAAYVDPYHFDIRRDFGAPHVAFGHATHFCVGAQLARVEIQAVLRGLIARWSSLSAAGPVTRVPTPMINGYHRLPIALHGGIDLRASARREIMRSNVR